MSESASDETKANDETATTTPASESPSASAVVRDPPSSEGSITTTLSATTATTATPAAAAAEGKVKVHFVAVGSAPIMKKTKFLIGSNQRFSAVTAFLRKMLKLSGSGSALFMYCNSAFVPGPDELVGDLRDCFNIGGELIIHYSLQEAWG